MRRVEIRHESLLDGFPNLIAYPNSSQPAKKESKMPDKENIPAPRNSGMRPPIIEPTNNPIHISDRAIISL